MSFQFKSGCTLQDNINRIAAEQVAQACDYLTDPPNGNVHDGIHEARKCFKRLRGLVRMLRPALGKKIYRHENVRFRNLGRTLSSARDAQALVESFDLLEQAYQRRVSFDRMWPLRQRLSARRAVVAEDTTDLEARIGDVVAVLENATAAIDRWPLAQANPDDLARGLQRVYRRARKGWKRAQRQHDPDTLHDWRKRTKELRYHFRMLKGVDKPWAGCWHKGFKQLSDILGDHHDLEVLRGILDQMEDTDISPVAESEFRVLLRQQQDAFYREALRQGKALLQCKPKKLHQRVSKRLGLAGN